MEKYTVKSVFCVANQMVHVDLANRHGACFVQLPIKFTTYLAPGTEFDIFTFKDDRKVHMAYSFKNQLYFAWPIENHLVAAGILNQTSGLRDFSLDKMRFKYALLMAMQSNGVRPSLSMAKNIVRLNSANQR